MEASGHINADVHVNEHTPVTAREFSGFVTVSIGPDSSRVIIYLTTAKDAERLLSAATSAFVTLSARDNSHSALL